MIKSMTGYGKATAVLMNKNISVEVKSLNSKYFDLNLRLGNSFKDKEIEIRNILADTLERGKVEFSLNIESTLDDKPVSINKKLVKSYYNDLKEVGNELKLNGEDYLNIIMRIPNVLVPELSGEEEKLWLAIEKLIRTATKNIDTYRKKEGVALEKELVARVKNIQTNLKGVEKEDPKRLKAMKKRLHQNIEEFLNNQNLDENRFEQELFFYMEKLDITEEKVRLKNHCDYFLKTLKDKTVSKGKKLGFISQEMGREINTIGSKSNQAPIQKLVVQMKDELEKVKEQLANVL